jgi:hypothetical protein
LVPGIGGRRAAADWRRATLTLPSGLPVCGRDHGARPLCAGQEATAEARAQPLGPPYYVYYVASLDDLRFRPPRHALSAPPRCPGDPSPWDGAGDRTAPSRPGGCRPHRLRHPPGCPGRAGGPYRLSMGAPPEPCPGDRLSHPRGLRLPGQCRHHPLGGAPLRGLPGAQRGGATPARWARLLRASKIFRSCRKQRSMPAPRGRLPPPCKRAMHRHPPGGSCAPAAVFHRCRLLRGPHSLVLGEILMKRPDPNYAG